MDSFRKFQFFFRILTAMALFGCALYFPPKITMEYSIVAAIILCIFIVVFPITLFYVCLLLCLLSPYYFFVSWNIWWLVSGLVSAFFTLVFLPGSSLEEDAVIIPSDLVS